MLDFFSGLTRYHVCMCLYTFGYKIIILTFNYYSCPFLYSKFVPWTWLNFSYEYVLLNKKVLP